MSRSPTPTPSPVGKKPGAVLALHKVGSAYRYVIASGAGGNGGGGIRVTDSGTIPASDPKALETLRQKAGSSAAFVQVIPPEASILRSAPPKLVLDGTPEQVAGALSLVAEAELPTTIPAHRRGAGVLRAGAAHAVYAVGWMGPEGAIAHEAVTVPAVAALAALFRLTGAPSGLAVYTDQPSGVVAIVGAGKGESPRLFVRVLRDDASDTEAFKAVRDEALADVMADLDAEEPVRISSSLRLPARLPASIGLTGDDRHSDFALALGAAAFALEARADEQPLLTMTDRSPTAGRTIFTRIGDGLSTPRAAAVTAAVCVCVLLAGWIVAAPIKLSLLKSRVGEDSGNDTKAVQQRDWYKALNERRWPMTALIAELTSGAPEGVRIESLSVEQGRPATVTGTADSAASIEAWCGTLRGKIFTDVTPNVPAEDVSPIRFTITAKVADAMLAAVSELKPVTTSDAPRTTDSTSRGPRTGSSNNSGGSTASRPSGNSRSNNGGGGNGRSSSTPAASPSAPAEVPPALTDAQIERLNATAAMNAWAARKSYLMRSEGDPATRSRLEQEVTKIDARRKALGGGQ